ncbi:LysR family transcriptional regulator [Pseudomonas syringae]|nr:LysR family transcriptional regulator [Pseudomonas syringae]MBD8576245.1 LysR family transcriptional regulator [Pseudomonas syringae]MBD8791877.1 LysR family transcriptional regulator [Pseudomonas syringae]MBD8802616.1 LysR family transcriptional regulator [Pseudomonas syringae]MBD8813188.1 LysR family transcriptional regulator [Pseudomonas syringae]
MDRMLAMQVFVTVVECGSQTAAAEKLGLSRPVVSRCLQDLEAWLGGRVLHRTTRRLALTSIGSEVLPKCRRVLEQAADIQASVARPEDEPRGQVRVTASTSFGQARLTAAVAAFVVRYPRVRVDLQLLDRTVNLVEEGIDLAIRISDDIDPQLIARRLARCDSHVCASPQYLKRHGTPTRPEDLEPHNCLTHAYHDTALWRFERDGEPLAVRVSGTISSNDAVALMQAVLNHAGIGLLPAYLVAPLIRSGHLVALLPDCQPTSLGIHAVYASRKHMPVALRALLDFLVEWFAGVQDWT